MNPVVRQCRGTIVEVTDKCRVICAPYLKFFNYGQHEADTIDWTTAKIREKIDDAGYDVIPETKTEEKLSNSAILPASQ